MTKHTEQWRKALFLGGLLVLASALSLTPAVIAGSHPTITIKSDSDFTTCGCVSSGSGTSSNPYILSGLTLYSKTGPGLLVDNTAGQITKYFVISSDTVTGGNGPPTSFPGVEFINVNGLGSITGGQNTFNGNQYGIMLVNSQNILIDGVSDETGSSASGNGIAGISIVGGGSNTVSNIQVTHNGIGIPDGFFGGGMGLQLNGTSHNTITNVILSEDSFTGLFIYQSSDNVVTGVVVHYPDFYAAIVDGGSGNTVQSSTFQTGDYVGLWLRDSTSGNLISGNSMLANGPVGREINKGIVPYFTVGLYISSGATDNQIQNNNFNNGNTGGSIIQDNGNIINAVQSPIQSNNPFNDPATGNEPSSPVFPSGPAGPGNTFCGNAIVSSQGVPGNPPC
jgi:parallel beta-helix repeat protein